MNTQSTTPALTVPDSRRIAEEVAALYRTVDLPPPSISYPIAPLGPLLDALPLVCREIPGLTSRAAEAYLLRRGGLPESFAPGVATDEPLAGFLYAGDDQSFVFLRADDPVFRRRFSLAHELGHLVLHLPGWLEGQMESGTELLDHFTPDQAESRGAATDTGSHSFRESEADAFAAELLMPAPLMRHLVAAARRDGLSGTGLAEWVAITLLVSRAAVGRRLVALGLASADAAPGSGELEKELEIALAEPAA
jgi:Predicted Zn peptidase